MKYMYQVLMCPCKKNTWGDQGYWQSEKSHGDKCTRMETFMFFSMEHFSFVALWYGQLKVRQDFMAPYYKFQESSSNG